MSPPVVFVHFPKAAGTTVRRQFRRALGPALLEDYQNRPLTPQRFDTAPEIPRDTRVVMGHFIPGRYAQQPCRLVTILREPVDNVISVWKHWRRNGLLASDVPLIDFASRPEIRHWMSKTYFDGFDMGRFAFIGFYDRLSEDLPAIGDMCGVVLNADQFANVAPPESAEPPTAGLARILADDIAFYGALRARVE